jgi:hypothetical protein
LDKAPDQLRGRYKFELVGSKFPGQATCLAMSCIDAKW